MLKKTLLMIIFIIIITNCTQQKEIKEIRIPGHAHTYVFSYDIRESLQIPANNEVGIRKLVNSTDIIYFVFNGSSTKDNAYFQVVSINIISKLQTYFAYEGKLMRFDAFYFVDGQWYNRTNDKVEKPLLDTVIWLMGPNTGAKETSLTLDNNDENIIYLQGTSYENLVMAGDRLALIVMGVEKVG